MPIAYGMIHGHKSVHSSGGVAATPTFMVNDVFVSATPSWTLDDWKKLIDPLLANKTSHKLVRPFSFPKMYITWQHIKLKEMGQLSNAI